MNEHLFACRFWLERGQPCHKHGTVRRRSLQNEGLIRLRTLLISWALVVLPLIFSWRKGTLKSYELVTPYGFPSGHLTSGWSHSICDRRKEVSLWHLSSNAKRTILSSTTIRTRMVRPGKNGRPALPTKTHWSVRRRWRTNSSRELFSRPPIRPLQSSF